MAIRLIVTIIKASPRLLGHARMDNLKIRFDYCFRNRPKFKIGTNGFSENCSRAITNSA